ITVLACLGIYEKLDYIQDLGVDAIWVQPFYKSPMKDNGYDVADYTGVNPLLGTLDDVKKLINATHDRGMKFLMDFVPNHSSDECEWFKLSLKRVDPFTNFYIWKDGVPINATHTTNPNNWASRFTGSAWTWREERKQYYLHQFAKNQPDLNFRDPKTRQTVEFKDKPQIHDYRTVPNEWFALDHIYTMALPESYGLVRDWGALLNEYKKRDGRTRILMTEDYDSPAVLIKYLENATSPGAQIPLYLTMTEMSSTTNASRLDWWVHSMSDVFPQGYFNWAYMTLFTDISGFTTAKKPWLPVTPSYYHINVKAQQQDPHSHLNIYKRLVKLRKTHIIQHGDFETFVHSEWVYIFTRSLDNEQIAVILNLGSESEEVCAKGSAFALPDTMFVHTSSVNSGFSFGNKVKISAEDGAPCLKLRPYAGIVLTTNHSVAVSCSLFVLFLTFCSNLLL
ncbi:unnamed protein product, partial [Bemisia tabaci]